LFTEVRAAGIPTVRYESNPQIQTLTLHNFCKIYPVVICKFKLTFYNQIQYYSPFYASVF